MKQDGSDLYDEDVDESFINIDDFINDADVKKKRGSTAILATLFHH